jgi:hypothetical protein
METIGYIITNSISVILVFVSWKNPKVGRVLFFILFLLASCFNLYAATQTPHVYQYFANLAWLNIYQEFITGWFKENADWFITAIGICQLLIAMSLLTKGKLLKFGTIGAVCFLISISPLGAGSAFPSTLIMAIGLCFIYKSVDPKLQENSTSQVPITH